MLLGRDTLRLTGAYDFVEGCLSSSAFPLVFSPRPESALLPGVGRTDVLFADGGMLDNLPFFPAIEVLEQAQKERTDAFTAPEDVVEDLRKRNAGRHLIIAAALDAEPGAEYDHTHTNINRIRKRADALSTQVKSEEFERSSRIVIRQVEDFLAGDPVGRVAADPGAAAILNAVVMADIIRVVPSDADHINPTYAFCRTVGLRDDRLRRSIANGCFRALLTMVQEAHPLVPVISVNGTPDIKAGTCVHFLRAGETMQCPFAGGDETVAIYRQCAADRVQASELRALQKA